MVAGRGMTVLWPRRDSGKRAVSLVAGVSFFVAGRDGCCSFATGRSGAGMCTLCSGAGGVMSCTLCSGAGIGGGKGGAVARFKIWAIWM
jgi:hypothetical protein